MRIFILANREEEYKYFVKNNMVGFSKTDVSHLTNLNQLRGIRDIRIIILENYDYQKNRELMDAIYHIQMMRKY